MTRRRRRSSGLKLERSGPWIAIIGLLMMLWCTIATGIYAPWWGILLAFVLLIPQVWLVAKWAKTKPKLTMVVPVVGLAAWALLSLVGAVLWDWHA
ncbi:MAG: hypothetical protein ABIN55_09010 [Aeromicrobium sp.]